MLLKVPKCEIFDDSDFDDFYSIKSLAYASVPDAHAQHAHQFSYFSNVHFVYPQHARKKLMRALSMHFRN